MDGIIQKIFYNWKKYHNMFQTKPIQELEQQLIEEIKKSHNNGGCDITCGNTKECRFIEELIGDNE